MRANGPRRVRWCPRRHPPGTGPRAGSIASSSPTTSSHGPETNAALPAPYLPAASTNPYAGLAPASAIALDVYFQDNFGNRTDGGAMSGSLAVPVGYRDVIQPLSAWPGVATSYLVRKADPQPGGGVGIGIEIDAGFRVANYVSGAGQSVAQARKRIAADQEKMRQIYYQIIQPDLQVTMSSSLDGADGVPALNSLPKSAFVDTVNASLLFFGQQLALAQVSTPVRAGDTLSSLNATWLLADPGCAAEGQRRDDGRRLLRPRRTEYPAHRAGDRARAGRARASSTSRRARAPRWAAP